MKVKILPSSKKNKKIDVYKDGKYLVSIGDFRYNDYPTYVLTKGKAYADKRRKLYYERHATNNGLAGIYAKRLLW
jgi:hypothetical protein